MRAYAFLLGSVLPPFCPGHLFDVFVLSRARTSKTGRKKQCGQETYTKDYTTLLHTCLTTAFPLSTIRHGL
jgi:hypothetical protein